MALKKLCPKCNKIIDAEKRHCAECESKLADRHKTYDKTVRYTKDRKYSEFYKSSEWARVRKAALVRDNGLCQHCLKVGRIKTADMVHHIKEIKHNWDKRLTLSNLISLCNRCHAEVDHKGRG